MNDTLNGVYQYLIDNIPIKISYINNSILIGKYKIIINVTKNTPKLIIFNLYEEMMVIHAIKKAEFDLNDPEYLPSLTQFLKARL